MSALISPHWIQDLIQTYGLWVLFALVMLESMGVPMPGETALVSAAVYAGATHQISIVWVVLIAAVAAIVGDNCGYLTGRIFGLPLIEHHGQRVGLTKAKLKVGQYLFLRYGGKIVFFGRFVAFLRTFAAVLAGVNRMDWPHFLAMNALGAICWATLFGGGAYLFGDQVHSVAGPLSLGLLVVAVAGVGAGIMFFRHHEQALEARAEAALAAAGAAKRR